MKYDYKRPWLSSKASVSPDTSYIIIVAAVEEDAE